MSDGTEKLIARILDEAKTDAANTIAQANERAGEIRTSGKQRVEEIRQKGEEQAKQLEADIVFRAKKNAELDAKKDALSMRHSVIDKAFSEALNKLEKMDSSQAETFFRKVLFREAEGGETVRPSKKHSSVISSVISDINKMFDKENTEHISMGEITDEIADGFILEGNGYVKNCTFATMFEDLKEREIGQIADILF